jgi:hypothetical protein
MVLIWRLASKNPKAVQLSGLYMLYTELGVRIRVWMLTRLICRKFVNTVQQQLLTIGGPGT